MKTVKLIANGSFNIFLSVEIMVLSVSFYWLNPITFSIHLHLTITTGSYFGKTRVAELYFRPSAVYARYDPGNNSPFS